MTRVLTQTAASGWPTPTPSPLRRASLANIPAFKYVRTTMASRTQSSGIATAGSPSRPLGFDGSDSSAGDGASPQHLQHFVLCRYLQMCIVLAARQWSHTHLDVDGGPGLHDGGIVCSVPSRPGDASSASGFCRGQAARCKWARFIRRQDDCLRHDPQAPARLQIPVIWCFARWPAWKGTSVYASLPTPRATVRTSL